MSVMKDKPTRTSSTVRLQPRGGVTLSSRVAGLSAYQPPSHPLSITLHLDGNEGAAPPPELLETVSRRGVEAVRRYPSVRELEALLARRWGVEPSRVLVTGGGDDALDRACRVSLGPNRRLLLPVPTFEMLERYPRLVDAEIVSIPWPEGAYPTTRVLDAADSRTGAIAVVTPNNPTGAVATVETVRELSAAVPQALVIVDLAYVEFADEDPTAEVLTLPNVLVVRTLSKAWGLAGLRVGYAMGPTAIINGLRAAGSPYPVSGLSLALAATWLETGSDCVDGFVQRVRAERGQLYQLLAHYRAYPLPSQANFVLARFGDAGRVAALLAEAGIAVRGFPQRLGLESSLRITVPGEERDYGRLVNALETAYSTDPGAFRAGAGTYPGKEPA
ncbi:MAG: histidinol-phosphate aminotransferase family protein [bacterium]|nr:histidinol-phosphate aminotransferase family protein [bacterium]